MSEQSEQTLRHSDNQQEKPSGDSRQNQQENKESRATRPGPIPRRPFPRRKVCFFCKEKIDEIDYKNVRQLRKFVTERGKIIPRRITGTCAFHQRRLSKAIKRARIVALLPFKAG